MTNAWMLTSRRLLGAAVLAAVLAASTTGCGSKDSLTGMALPALGSNDRVDGALVDGQRYVKGDPITGTGRLVVLEALPGGGKDGGCFRSSGTYCGALDAGVLVIDDIG